MDLAQWATFNGILPTGLLPIGYCLLSVGLLAAGLLALSSLAMSSLAVGLSAVGSQLIDWPLPGAALATLSLCCELRVGRADAGDELADLLGVFDAFAGLNPGAHVNGPGPHHAHALRDVCNAEPTT
jgi:hypothetical protein